MPSRTEDRCRDDMHPIIACIGKLSATDNHRKKGWLAIFLRSIRCHLAAQTPEAFRSLICFGIAQLYLDSCPSSSMLYDGIDFETVLIPIIAKLVSQSWIG